MDTAAVNNLPQGISVNCCLADLKGHVMPVIMINQNKHNVWIQHPLLVVEIFGCNISHGIMGRVTSKGGGKLEVAFQPLTMGDIMASVEVVHDEPEKVPSKEETSPDHHPHLDPIPTPK